MWVDLDGLKLVEFVRKAMKHASLARRLGWSVPLWRMLRPRGRSAVGSSMWCGA